MYRQTIGEEDMKEDVPPDNLKIVWKSKGEREWFDFSDEAWEQITHADDWYNFCHTQSRPIRDDFHQFRVQFLYKGEYENAMRFLDRLKTFIRTEKIK
jgi:hypothetical protein